MNGGELVYPLPLIAAVVDALRAVVLRQKLIGKVSPRPAPDLGVFPVVPVHKVNLAGLVPSAGQTDFLAVFIQHIFLFGLRKPSALFVQRAHGQQDMGVGVAASRVVQIEVGDHALGNKLRGTIFPHKAGLFLSGQLHGQGNLHFLRKLGVIGFLGKLHAVPQGAAVRESGQGVRRKQYFRMDNAALFRVVVGQSVPLVCQLFTASVGGCGYGGFAFSPADDLDAAMVDCDGITSVSLVRT